MNKYVVVTYRNPHDFKFGGWSYEHHENGGTTIYGMLKKKNIRSKFQDIKRC